MEPCPTWERWTRALLLLGFVAVGIEHIHTNTIYGQDFLLHSTSTEAIITDPGRWFPQDFTNRPLLYWLGAACHWVTHGKGTWEVAGLVFVALNTLALYLLHDTTRRFIRSPALRLAALGFVAFLPATQVAGIVYAADAICQLPFVLLLWGLLRALEADGPRARLGYALVAGLAVTVGCFARFTFLALLPAAAVVIVLAARWRRVTWGQAAAIAALAVLAPALPAGWLQHRAQQAFAAEPPHHQFDWHGTGEMTWSSLLLLKPADRHILDAPVYWDSEILENRPRYSLLINNRYSYPALLHLGTFTDVLDYANDGEIDDGAPRPEPQKTLARWSVRLGLPFSVAMLLATLAFAARAAYAVARPAAAPSLGLTAWGLGALAWFLPIALSLPFLANAYDWGYWLSRLVIPALWGFGVVLFATVDERWPRARWLANLLAGLVAVQALLHIRSLWY